jgi:Flp pilus assembly pilin Flp
MKASLLSFWMDESGQDLADYAVLLALVALLLFIVFAAYRSAVEGKFMAAARTLRIRT